LANPPLPGRTGLPPPSRQISGSAVPPITADMAICAPVLILELLIADPPGKDIPNLFVLQTISYALQQKHY
jgi:hypothetical protein